MYKKLLCVAAVAGAAFFTMGAEAADVQIIDGSFSQPAYVFLKKDFHGPDNKIPPRPDKREQRRREEARRPAPAPAHNPGHDLKKHDRQHFGLIDVNLGGSKKRDRETVIVKESRGPHGGPGMTPGRDRGPGGDRGGRDRAPGQMKNQPGRNNAPGQMKNQPGRNNAPGQMKNQPGRNNAPGQMKQQSNKGNGQNKMPGNNSGQPGGRK